MSNFYDLKIKNLEKLTDNSIAVTFEVPSELKNNFNFYSGQYVNLEIL
jgi:hypothetical protein